MFVLSLSILILMSVPCIFWCVDVAFGFAILICICLFVSLFALRLCFDKCGACAVLRTFYFISYMSFKDYFSDWVLYCFWLWFYHIFKRTIVVSFDALLFVYLLLYFVATGLWLISFEFGFTSSDHLLCIKNCSFTFSCVCCVFSGWSPTDP